MMKVNETACEGGYSGVLKSILTPAHPDTL